MQTNLRKKVIVTGLGVLIGIMSVSLCHAITIGTPYLALTGGYENYQDVSGNDGSTPVARFALGTMFPYTCNLSFGGELGIQSGNRMRLDTDDVSSVIGTLPVFLTIRQPIDLLATVKYRFYPTAYAVGKLGIAYLNGMVDSATINNLSEVRPEIQLGAGWDMTERTSLVAYYQAIIGNTPNLSVDNADLGTATLHHLPTSQAIYVGIEMHL